MRIKIETPVARDMKTVFAGFTQDLFDALIPPEVPVKLLRFDGSRTGDEVHLELSFIFFKQKWISVITDDGESEDECFFVDEGRTLPFFLKFWRHRHRILRAPDGGDGAVIVDDIEYRAPIPGMGLILYPILRRQFKARGPIYQRIFGKPA